jgi:hypothetical protein
MAEYEVKVKLFTAGDARTEIKDLEQYILTLLSDSIYIRPETVAAVEVLPGPKNIEQWWYTDGIIDLVPLWRQSRVQAYWCSGDTKILKLECIDPSKTLTKGRAYFAVTERKFGAWHSGSYTVYRLVNDKGIVAEYKENRFAITEIMPLYQAAQLYEGKRLKEIHL